MRGILQFIAFAILTLLGPVELARTFVAPAIPVCACACEASAEGACGCGMLPTAPGRGANPAPCSPLDAPCGLRTAAPAVVGLAAATPAEPGATRAGRPESMPWPHSVASLVAPGQTPAPSARLAEAEPWAGGRPLDRLAMLSVFRI